MSFFPTLDRSLRSKLLGAKLIFRQSNTFTVLHSKRVYFLINRRGGLKARDVREMPVPLLPPTATFICPLSVRLSLEARTIIYNRGRFPPE